MTKSKRERYIIGVDLGGTNIVCGAMPEDGSREIAMRSQPTYSELGADTVVDRMVQMIEDVIAVTMAETGAAREDFLGVGVGAPGPLDRERGVVIVAPNLGWRDFPLRDLIGERVGLAATLDNDANCATVGEWWVGAAKGGRNVVGLTIGTGIGGGLILDGKLYHGSSDVAGEIGHTTIDSTGRRCKCGNYGCLEAYTSGPAIAERAREALAGDPNSILPGMVQGRLERITAQTVYDASRLGDLIAREVVRDTARLLGAGIANLLNIFNPDVVVIAGGVTAAGDALFEPLRAEVRRRAFKPAVEACRIVPGSLPGSAGVVGAVATFKQQHVGAV
ncbi:MAG TPA: ROK family protein [Gemmatimonadaceae bacterium]|nr:ROK family protein [Gemmatimonadaceae bacterium]